MFRKEVEILVKLSVIEESNDSEWVAPSCAHPKAKTNRTLFLSYFRNLNRQIKRKPYPMPKIQEILLNLEGFQYANSLDLNMGCYRICISKESSNLCTIILTFGKYKYKCLPKWICNSPYIFQDKMIEMFCGIEFIKS